MLRHCKNHFSTSVATSKSTPINHLHKQQKQTCKACMCTEKAHGLTCGACKGCMCTEKAHGLLSNVWRSTRRPFFFFTRSEVASVASCLLSHEVVSPSPLLCRRQATHARAVVSSSCVSHSCNPQQRSVRGARGRARVRRAGSPCHICLAFCRVPGPLPGHLPVSADWLTLCLPQPARSTGYFVSFCRRWGRACPSRCGLWSVVCSLRLAEAAMVSRLSR